MESIFYLMLGAAVLIALVSLVRHRRKVWVDAGQSLNDTLMACRAILALTAHFQQHRGMSSALLSGDKSFGFKLDSKAREIDALAQSLRMIARSESNKPHPCLTSNDLALFLHHWGRLREKLAELSVEQSIAQHSFLIEQLLAWLAALGEARVEPLVGDHCSRTVVRNYSRRLPALAECLGQARAIGMSVATRKGCSAVARVRLMFLIARAEALHSQAADGVPGGGMGERANIAVQQMARMVRTRMLVSSGISVSAQEYFGVATMAIDSVFDWVGESGEQLAGAGLKAVDGRLSAHAS